jgi:hypothetical protein
VLRRSAQSGLNHLPRELPMRPALAVCLLLLLAPLALAACRVAPGNEAYPADAARPNPLQAGGGGGAGGM